jgi:hypothetical protein
MVKDPIVKATFRLPLSMLVAVKQYALDHSMTEQEVFMDATRNFLSKPVQSEGQKEANNS